MTVLSLSSVRVTYSDAESLIYLSSANMGLKQLQLTANRLDPPSLDMISKLLLLQKWPNMESINLSCNKTINLQIKMRGEKPPLSLLFIKRLDIGYRQPDHQ
jgi:Leucine-rich repeat (LRR) protein